MRRLPLVLLLACGPSTTQQPIQRETLGSTVHAQPGDHRPSTLEDPSRTFRTSYAAPGGMWTPAQMPLFDKTFKDMGTVIAAKTLSDPLSDPLASVVSLGGCTGSFVSPDGLIVTNHHCVQKALETVSDDKHNYVQDGFYAPSTAEEKPANASQRVMVAQALTDVTKQVRDGLDKIADPIARKEEHDKRTKQLIAQCEKDRPQIRCSVSGFFGGGQYTLIEMLELKDVRIVFVPPRSVGNYGGEVDNWEWPRHTGDFSFFRAYVAKDGKPATYAADNVPYHPKHWLKVSTAGMKASDFVMVTGYPGRTTRTGTGPEIHFDLEWGYPYRIAALDERYKLADAHLKDGGETAIKATTMKQGIQNYLEKYQGILQGFQKNPDLLKQKDDLDKKTREWAAQPGHEDYKAAIDKLDAIVTERNRTARADFDRNEAFGASRLLSTALSLTKWADERAKPDAERRPGFQERDLDRARSGQKQLTHDYDAVLDRAQLRLALVRAATAPEADRPWLAVLLDAKKGAKIDEALIDKTLDGWYKAPLLLDDKLRLSLLDKGTKKDLESSKDPFLKAAQRVWSIYKAEEKKADQRAGELMVVEPMYVDAMKQTLGGALAPDANGTLRITFGTVRSLHPDSKETADWPFTVASQIPAKNTGKEPFDAPQKVLDAIKAKHYGPYADAELGGELPVDFLADLDITNGNSGSPALNNKGELVGLAFDGNKEGLASDVVFDGKTTRSIIVDARYLLWNLELDGAKALVKEMGIEPKL